MSRQAQLPSDAFQRATQLHQAGQLQQAEALYRQVLAINPGHAESIHLLGVIALQVGQPANALPYFDRAIGLQPRVPEYHNNRGNALRRLGQLSEAEAAFREALRLRGRFPDALHNLGTLLLTLGRFAEAETCGRKAVRLRPDGWQAQTLLGDALGALGRWTEAETCHRAAVRLNPSAANVFTRLGYTLTQLDRSAEAESCYREASRLAPNSADARNNLGCCLKDLGRAAEAEPCFREALRLRPNSPATLANLADALRTLERYQEAETCCRAALQIEPDFADAHSTLGSILGAVGRLPEAEAACGRALQLRPNFALAHNNLGWIMAKRDRNAEAVVCFRNALRLKPNFPEGANNLAHALTRLGHLDEAEAHLESILRLRPNFLEAQVNLGNLRLAQCRPREAIQQYNHVLAQDPHFTSAWRGLLDALPYLPGLDPRESLDTHTAFGRAMAEMATKKPLTNDRHPDRRLRVGWLSSDFHDHPVGRNLELFFRHRNKAAFETYCYADIRTPSPLTDWFRDQSDMWRSISGLTDAAVAELIRGDRIDIMIYLAGRFDRNRPEIAAWRPAPVQVSLFDAATSGLADMDYFISDRIMIPARPVEKFTERPLRLPNFYLHAPPADSPTPGAPPALSRSVTFGCFHNPTKLNADVLALWARLLRRIPDARLRVKYMDFFAAEDSRKSFRTRLGAEFSDRVDFVTTRTLTGKHLAEYNEIDIALDPFPFNGSTASFEALWMGVPVVALAGDTHMGRWAASMLTKVGLHDLIAASPEEYVEIAARLAGDHGRLVELRQGLRERVRRSVLCDGPRTTRYLERALRAVWRKWCRDGLGGGRPSIEPAPDSAH